MKKLTTLLLALIFSLTLSLGAKAEFFTDIIVTSPNGIWTDSRAYSTLNDAIAAVGANERTITIVSPQTVSTLTVPSNVTLKFERNGSITNSGQLTINTTNIIAPNRQIFTGVGNIDFATGTIVKSGWFPNFESALALTVDDTATLKVTKPQTLTASFAVGNNVTLSWDSPGNILTANAGVTVSNIGQVNAGSFQLFAGSGDFDFRAGSVLKSSWFSSLSAADTYTDDDNVDLTIEVDRPETVAVDTTFDQYQGLKVNKGCPITINTGVVLTQSGSFEAELYQVFDCVGTGKVVFVGGSVTEVMVEWFGAKADWAGAKTDNTIPTNKAYLSIPDGGTIRFSTGSYYFDTYVSPQSYIKIKAMGYGDHGGTYLRPKTRLFNFTGQTDIGFQDFTVIGEGTGDGSAFYFASGLNHHIDIERVWVQNAYHAIYIGAAATIVTLDVSKCNFIYNSHEHLLTENGATIEEMAFTDTRFDAQNNTVKAGHVAYNGAVGWSRYTRCLFQSASSLYSVYLSGNDPVTFTDSMWYNNANDSQGIITDGANVYTGVGNSLVEFNGCQLLRPKSTAVNFYHIRAHGTGTMDRVVVVSNCHIDLTDTAGLILADSDKPSNITVMNSRCTESAGGTYNAMTGAGTAPRLYNNHRISSKAFIIDDIVKEVQTTDAVATIIQGGQYTVQPSTSILISYDVMGRNADNTVYAAYSGQNLFTIDANRVVTDRGTLGAANVIETDAGMAVTFVVISDGAVPAGIIIRVTGVAATTIDWVCRVRIMVLGSGHYPL